MTSVKYECNKCHKRFWLFQLCISKLTHFCPNCKEFVFKIHLANKTDYSRY